MAELKVQIYISEPLKNRLKKLAADREVSIQFLSETAIEDFILKLEKKPGGKKTK